MAASVGNYGILVHTGKWACDWKIYLQCDKIYSKQQLSSVCGFPIPNSDFRVCMTDSKGRTHGNCVPGYETTTWLQDKTCEFTKQGGEAVLTFEVRVGFQDQHDNAGNAMGTLTIVFEC